MSKTGLFSFYESLYYFLPSVCTIIRRQTGAIRLHCVMYPRLHTAIWSSAQNFLDWPTGNFKEVYKILMNFSLVKFLSSFRSRDSWLQSKNDCGYIKILYVNCGLRNKYDSNLRSIEHFLSSSENKVGKKSGLAGFEPMSCAIPCLYDFHTSTVIYS